MNSSTDDNSTPFENLDELITLLDQFDACTLDSEKWNHRSRLAVTAWYLCNCDEPDAADRIIAGIRRYNRIRNIRTGQRSGYHETRTLFWLAVARRFLAIDTDENTLARVNRFVQAYGDREHLPLDYYSEDRITSRMARNCWVEPDIKSIDNIQIHPSASSASKFR